MGWLLALPIIIPALFAATGLTFWRRTKVQTWLALAGSACLIASGAMLLREVYLHGIQSLQVGGWPAPFGITLVADHFSALMILVTSFLAFCSTLYSRAEIDRERASSGYFSALMALFTGVNGAYLAGDIFNLYVWFEVMVIASFVLLTMGRNPKQIRGAVPYITLNLFASMFFLMGIGVIYGLTGALNLAELSMRLQRLPESGPVVTVSMLFLTGFGIKAGLFPLFFWLPASYHTPPPAVSAVFSGLFTKVGVYALIRTFTLLFTRDVAFTHTIILALSVLTMFVGVMGAVAQFELRRLLAFHIISQIGYMTFGLALMNRAGVAGAVFFMVHNILAKSSLFLVSGVIFRLRSSFDLKSLGGLYKDHPFLAALFLIPALSLAGFPPSSGFWGKLELIRAGFEAEAYFVAGVSLFVGFLTTFSMTKVWVEAFWKRTPGALPAPEVLPVGWVAPLILLVMATLFIGLLPEALMSVARRAADELLNPSAYINAVLGGGK